MALNMYYTILRSLINPPSSHRRWALLSSPIAPMRDLRHSLELAVGARFWGQAMWCWNPCLSPLPFDGSPCCRQVVSAQCPELSSQEWGSPCTHSSSPVCLSESAALEEDSWSEGDSDMVLVLFFPQESWPIDGQMQNLKEGSCVGNTTTTAKTCFCILTFYLSVI